VNFPLTLLASHVQKSSSSFLLLFSCARFFSVWFLSAAGFAVSNWANWVGGWVADWAGDYSAMLSSSSSVLRNTMELGICHKAARIAPVSQLCWGPWRCRSLVSLHGNPKITNFVTEVTVKTGLWHMTQTNCHVGWHCVLHDSETSLACAWRNRMQSWDQLQLS